ncbi:MAG TPA: hypothetical protein VK473_01880 [Terriglobales bacterium]|nr:hypothetical protein [Terriglobales bacterium]
MICPYCHVEYTATRPCFCQPRADASKLESAEAKPESVAVDQPPAGLGNPFWN